MMFNYYEDAEMSIIGAILIDDKTVLPLIVDILKPVHFYNKRLGKIYETLLQMEYKNKRIDFVTVHDELLTQGFVSEDIKQLLLTCIDLCPTIHNAVDHAKIIAKGYKTRKLSEIAETILEKNAEHDTVDEVINTACDKLTELATDNQDKGLMPIGDIIVQDVSKMFDKENLKSRLDFSIGNVDRILDGVFKTNFVIIGARPAVGKTAFAMQVAKNVAKKDKKVAFFNLEMGREQVLQRYLSSISKINMKQIKNIDLSKDEMSRVMKSCEVLYPLPLDICSNPYMTVLDIKMKCRFNHYDLIIIDYMQLIQPRAGHKYINRAEAVGQISRDLKILAMELDVPIIALSQLNRVTDEEKEPSLSDLRESGSLEQDADTVLMLWKYDAEEKLIGCKICKNRNGTTGKSIIAFDGAHMEFRSSNVKAQKRRRKEEWED